MTGWITALYIAGAVLPTLGFARLLLRSQRTVRAFDRMVEERGYSHYSYDDADREDRRDVRAPLWAERRDIVWDTALVGAGLVASCVASVWSLHV